MTLNLVQHRGEPSVWDRTSTGPVDIERWVAAAAAGAFLAAAFRRRSTPGLLLALGAGGLAWWAASGADVRQSRIARLRAVMPRRISEGDCVHEAAEESFPASDAPSWTATTGHAPSSVHPSRAN